MNRLTILSPHQDDAVFSLAFSIGKWRTLPLEIDVVNFFTRSNYGPKITLSDPDLSSTRASISVVRTREDKHALRNLDPSIRVRNLAFLDAPLRRRATLDSVFRPESVPVLQSEVNMLAGVIQRFARQSLILSPLGIGDHVDHLTVRAAALSAVRQERLGFYEDAPYVRWTPEEQVQSKLQETHCNLRGRPMITTSCSRYKLHLVLRYQSQIDRSEAIKIANHRRAISAKERIWTPAHASIWRLLFRP